MNKVVADNEKPSDVFGNPPRMAKIFNGSGPR